MFIVLIYSSLFLGEIGGFYFKFWWWDNMLHALSAVMLSVLGFIIVYVLYSGKKVSASASLVSVFAFGFAVSLGAIWEIFEFIMDNVFYLNMQKSGLVDTMTDLIVDTIVAAFVCSAGYLYIKYDKGYLINKIIKRMRSNRKI
ncbi:MAG: hypothetical protein ABH857_03055 [Elusimicrobiota bacterium]